MKSKKTYFLIMLLFISNFSFVKCAQDDKEFFDQAEKVAYQRLAVTMIASMFVIGGIGCYSNREGDSVSEDRNRFYPRSMREIMRVCDEVITGQVFGDDISERPQAHELYCSIDDLRNKGYQHNLKKEQREQRRLQKREAEARKKEQAMRNFFGR